MAQARKYTKAYFYIYLIICMFTLWIATTSTIQRFKCPKMTQTELFLNIKNSVLLNFKNC